MSSFILPTNQGKQVQPATALMRCGQNQSASPVLEAICSKEGNEGDPRDTGVLSREIAFKSGVQHTDFMIQAAGLSVKDPIRVRGITLDKPERPRNRYNHDLHHDLQFPDRERRIMVELYYERRYFDYRRKVTEKTERIVCRNIEQRFVNSCLQ